MVMYEETFYRRHTALTPAAVYPEHKLVFLALMWAVTDKFHDYLYWTRFEVMTDNNPLTAILDATGPRWVISVSNYKSSLT